MCWACNSCPYPILFLKAGPQRNPFQKIYKQPIMWYSLGLYTFTVQLIGLKIQPQSSLMCYVTVTRVKKTVQIHLNVVRGQVSWQPYRPLSNAGLKNLSSGPLAGLLNPVVVKWLCDYLSIGLNLRFQEGLLPMLLFELKELWTSSFASKLGRAFLYGLFVLAFWASMYGV